MLLLQNKQYYNYTLEKICMIIIIIIAYNNNLFYIIIYNTVSYNYITIIDSYTCTFNVSFVSETVILISVPSIHNTYTTLNSNDIINF